MGLHCVHCSLLCAHISIGVNFCCGVSAVRALQPTRLGQSLAYNASGKPQTRCGHPSPTPHQIGLYFLIPNGVRFQPPIFIKENGFQLAT